MPSDHPSHGDAPRFILIVDDDELMRIFYKRLFNQHRDEFSVFLMPSAEAALEYLRESNADAAILDWDLPGISGLQLLKALRANPATKALPVIIVSGRSSPDNEAFALKSGAHAYFSKPFDVGGLLSRLRSLVP
jgi:two-component system phosphate regulon response regulator PhoB